MHADALIDWIRLIRTEGIGPVRFRQLVERHGSPAEALHHLPIFKPDLKIVTPAAAEAELAAANRAGLSYLTWADPAYPAALKAIDDAPPVLTLKGDPAILSRPCFAVVGARNASVNGQKLARMLAGDLSRTGWAIVSGMARGIDGAAHVAALEAGGPTAAVLAGGADVIYPPEHRALYERIAAAGVVLSEVPPGTEPTAAAFPRRNRLISGLSRGVLVVEASLRSGSLITARLAGEQGREVFAVPGSPLDPRAQGPNSLIRDGAVLVERADDILVAMEGSRGEISKLTVRMKEDRQVIEKTDVENTQDLRQRIEAALGPGPTAVDEVVRQCQVSPALVATALMELELAGRLERHPGNRVALIGRS
jgi:DNA processing protein